MADGDFIKEIQTAEEEAKAMVARAQEEASERRRRARAEADRFVDEAYREATSERQAIMAEAEKTYRDMLADLNEGDLAERAETDPSDLRKALPIIAERIVNLLGNH